MAIDEKPLVTFLLFCFNQQDTVEAAMAAALDQTYQPLEIIVSDDCSTDETFARLARMVANYVGEHRVYLNRNNVNLGIGGHVALLHEQALGDVVVHAAGDDISMPERVHRIMEAYLGQPSRALLIETNAYLIDEAGTRQGLYHSPRATGHFVVSDPWEKLTSGGGATYAFSRVLIDYFDPIPADFIAEDDLLNVRANLLEGVLYVSEPLLEYRVTAKGVWNSMIDQQLSKAKVVANEARWTRHRVRVCEQALADLSKLESDARISSDRARASRVALCRAQAELKRWKTLVMSEFPSSGLMLFLGLVRNEKISRTRWVKMFLIRWVGPLFDKLRDRN